MGSGVAPEIVRPWWWRTIKTRVSWCGSPISNTFYSWLSLLLLGVHVFFSNRTMFNKKVSLSQTILLGLWGNIYIYVLYIDVFKHALSTHISIFHDIESTYIYNHDVYAIFVYCFHAKSVSICNIYRVWSCYVRICIYISISNQI